MCTHSPSTRVCKLHIPALELFFFNFNFYFLQCHPFVAYLYQLTCRYSSISHTRLTTHPHAQTHVHHSRCTVHPSRGRTHARCWGGRGTAPSLSLPLHGGSVLPPASPLLIYTLVGEQTGAAQDVGGSGCPCPFPLPHRSPAQPALMNGPFHFSAARGAAPEES